MGLLNRFKKKSETEQEEVKENLQEVVNDSEELKANPESEKDNTLKKRLRIPFSGKNKNENEKEPYKQENTKNDKKSLLSIDGLMKRIFPDSCDEVIELGFDVGKVEEPQMGVPLRNVNLTYAAKEPFQYVHVEFNGEELEYTCLEPPLSEGEERYLQIIEGAFEKLTTTEILVIDSEQRDEALRQRFAMIIDIYRLDMSEFQREKMFYYLLKKYTGFGNIDILMNDPYIEDITCNGHEMPLFVNHRMYGSVRTNVVFKEVELNNFVMRMAQSSGRHISVLQPIRDATLSDGSRVNLTLGKEVTRKGSTFTIRRFKSNPVSVIDLMNYKTYNSEVLAYLWIIVEYQRSVLASGGTASGKTTTLNALGSFIRPEYKIVSIEDTAEINLMHPNWTQSITRAGFGGGEGVEEAGNIQLYDLLKAALRQRPEYIIVGEVRGAEASTLFQAISVGHPCMGTIHAGSMKELVSRVESEPMNVPRNLFSSLDVVIFNAMIKVGEHFIRRALSIVELVEVDPDRGDIITNPVFKWNAYNDDYIFSGDSAMFEDISQEFGIEIPYLRKEMETRAQYLDYLQNNNIKEYKEVVRYIRRYARDKDDLMEQEDKERKSHSEADIEGKPGVEESLTIEEVVQNIEDVGSVV
ncbi:MAG: type IV secretion system protein [Methanohalophilus sp. T328-1]|uniref:type II/IV secretion system ATPase subunit n=1 Tax=Methanohalophilus sp. DAL1 TaxID=1864608 RepID=UPI000797EE6B|nr:type II/IV secretion system ATPase subunit [Methanohalophilus sp. DAL1]KXS46423.1 MAG: type IV secretion system protein [Methanohalophilus sp. T328-1]